nr:hemicentin-1 isoform X2 [Crassostrea gigas]
MPYERNDNGTAKMKISIALTLVYFPSFMYCQVISEVKADTCITFTKPNSTEVMYIKRYADPLCVFINMEVFPNVNAWNRSFTCNRSSYELSVCFSDTKISDSGSFYLFVRNIQENSTSLDVEYPPTVLQMGLQRTIEGRNLSVTCFYISGKPNATTFYWTKADSEFRYDYRTLWIPNIGREDSGSYVCNAENIYSSGNKGTANATIEIDVQYPPSVQPFDTQKPVEGTTLIIPCNVTDGNPAVTSIHWTRVGYSSSYYGANYTLSTVQRSHSGTYICRARNTYYDNSRGEADQSVTVNVEYPPSVTSFNTQYPTELSDLSIRCSATAGNPSNHVYYWTRSEDDSFRENNTYLRLNGIRRNESGSYICTAVNFYSTGGEGKDSKTLSVNVQYPPVVSPLPNVKRVEGEHVSILCNVTSGNPSYTTIYWTKSGDSGFRQSGSILRLNYISKSQSGTYSCVAENNYNNGEKGANHQSFFLDVLYGPVLTHGQTLRVSEGQSARMSTSITSNPASNVSWFRDNLLVSSQQSVNGTTSYTITRAECTDTGSFQVVASNGVQSNHSTTVNLYVYCSPRLTTGGSYVELYVGSNRYLNGQISLLSYPQPTASLTLPSGAPNTLVTVRSVTAATNSFTITLTKSNLQSDDFGTYVLSVANQYGRRTISVNIIPISKPFHATKVLVTCGHGQALVTWQSSYFGYRRQYSLVQYSTDNVKFINGSEITTEYTKEEILQTSVHNLQDSTHYFFRVFTMNTHGFSTSIPINCSTAATQESSSTSVVVGSVLGSLLFLAIGAMVFISYKYISERKASVRSYDALQREKTFADNHSYEPYDFSDQGVSTNEPKDSKKIESKPIKTIASKKEKKTKILKLERLDDLKKSTVVNNAYGTCVQDMQGVLQKTSRAPKKNVLKSLFHKTPKDIKKMEGSISEALDGADVKESLSSEMNLTETKSGEKLYDNTKDLAIPNTKIKPIVLPKPKKGQT